MTRRDYQPTVLNAALLPTWLRHWGFEDFEPMMSGSSARASYSLSEDDQHVYLEVPMAGVDPAAIDIHYEKGTLRIQAQAKKEENDPKRKYYKRMDASYGYTFSLPSNVNETQEPQAHYEHGVLAITFDKQLAATPRKIQVHTR